MIINHIKEQLEPGEIIEWQGKSDASKMLAYGDYMYIPFSIMWCGFVCYWEYLVIVNQYPLVFHILGIPMALIGLYMAVGRYVYKYYKKKNSCYVLTNLRVIEAYEDPKIGYKEKKLTDIGRMLRFVERNGSGTLVFDDINPAYMMKLNDGMEQVRRKTKKIIGFYDIPDAEALYERIQVLKEENKVAEDEPIAVNVIEDQK